MENDHYSRVKIQMNSERKEFLRKITNPNKEREDAEIRSKKIRVPMVISAITRNKIGERINLEKLHQKALKQALAEKMLNDSFTSQMGFENSVKTSLNNSVIASPNFNTSKLSFTEEAGKGNIFTECTTPSNLLKVKKDSIDLKASFHNTVKAGSDLSTFQRKPDNKVIMTTKIHYINTKINDYSNEMKESKVIRKMRTLSSPKVMVKSGLVNQMNGKSFEECQNSLIVTPTHGAGKSTAEKTTNSPIKTDAELSDLSVLNISALSKMIGKKTFEFIPRSPGNYLNKRGSETSTNASLIYHSRRIRSFNKKELLKPIQLSSTYNKQILDESDFELDIKSLKVPDIRHKLHGDFSNSKEFHNSNPMMGGLSAQNRALSEKREVNRDSTSSSENAHPNLSENNKKIRANYNPKFHVPIPPRKVSDAKKEHTDKKEEITALDNSENSSQDSTFRDYVMTTNGNLGPNMETEILIKI